ncbi:hypothetical protein HRG_013704 [Hirsutella rhossiliensis]
MLRYARGKVGDLSFFLGGRSESDDDKWQPDIGAVRATIQFALATKRFTFNLADRASVAEGRTLNTWRN